MASNASNHGGAATTITAVHSDIIETHILSKLDGQSLGSAASTCQLLYTPSCKEYLWEDICNSTWTSINDPRVHQAISTFPGGYRSFFSDSFPILRPNSHGRRLQRQPRVHTSELISAIDIRYQDNPVYSKVVVTKTDNDRFLESTFSINLLDRNESVEMPLKFEGDKGKCMLNLEQNMTFSWILIDPIRKRAANVSSLRPVSVQPHWDGSDIEVTYSTIISGDCNEGDTLEEFVECKIVATFSFKEGKDIEMREVTFHVEDMYKGVLNGEKSLGKLEEAMESGERKKGNGVEETKEKYVKYLETKRERRVEKKRKENRLDMVYRVMWVIHILTWVFFAICLRYALM